MAAAKSVSIVQERTEGGYERVLGFVREQLASGQLKAGDRLLPERELAVRLGISRPVIREVLRALAAMGVIEIRHGHGSVVREPDVSGLGDLFTLMLAQRADIIDDVMEARAAIERHAIRLACMRATPADITRLEAGLTEIAATFDDPVRGGTADFEFHATLVDAAHSPTLSTLYAAIATLLKRSHMERRQRITGVKGIETYLVDHHREILAALIARDPDRADRALGLHFEIGGDFQRKAAERGRTAG
jgi:GntR family transcriptional repressor for pyruvate dehydrogenase complex